MTSSFPLGSEWRKWDLHVHTPLARQENRYDNLSSFANAMVEQNLVLAWATNYFFIAENEFEITREAIARRLVLIL